MNTLRKTGVFNTEQPEEFKLRALQWAHNFSHLSFQTGNNFKFPGHCFPDMLAAGKLNILPYKPGSQFDELKKFHDHHQDWLFGFLGYDLKNEIEVLSSNNPDRTGFPDSCFFQPCHLLFFWGNEVKIASTEPPGKIFNQIQNTLKFPQETKTSTPSIKCNMSRTEYLEKVTKILNHIENGDIYEMNFCMEFYVENFFIDPLKVYWALNKVSPMPFSVFQKFEDQYLICASPERFLQKAGDKLLSQPIKGTQKRGKNDEEDQYLKKQLLEDEKERAENMMIVDLVRNDIAKSAVPGSVKVEELFGIYAFPQVFQMISSVSAQLKPQRHFVEAILNAFPMGSMTGAPKIKVMELIERYENSKRGIFSGAAGYITPDGNFDLNVIIRSMTYNQGTRNLSYHVGSAITYDAVPEKEYEECLLKAKAIREVLKQASEEEQPASF